MPYFERAPAAPAASAAPARPKGRSRYRILHAAGYLATAGVAVAESLELRSGPRLLWTLGLLACFAGALALVFGTEHGRSRTAFVAFSLAASAIGIGVMAVGAAPIYGAVLFFVICTIVGMRLPAGVAIAWVAGATVALAVCMIAGGETNWLASILSYGVGFFAFIAFAIAFRRSLQARAESEQLLAELTNAQGRMRDLAVMEERQRLAREMHDAVGHRLTAAVVLLEGAARLIPTDPGRATRMVETSRVQIRQGLDELRGAVSALHRELPGTQPLREVLSALVDVFSQGSGARVTLDLAPGHGEPEPDYKLVIVRTAQEALTNVQKHAVATQVELALKAESGAWILTCRDNGRGITRSLDGATEAHSGGYGLGNLQTRAAAFGGKVELESPADGGALLRLTLPMPGGALDA
jgi:signal transduction histidine kinase